MYAVSRRPRANPKPLGAFANRSRTMRSFVDKLVRDESGATAIEYGLIAALISVVIIGAITLVGTNLSTVFNKVATSLAAAS
jgi:pilus assembly protein Flp/PilA